MSHAYIIEVQSRSAGIVVRDGQRFYFHAAADEFSTLEGLPFGSPQQAQKAASSLVSKRAMPRAG